MRNFFKIELPDSFILTHLFSILNMLSSILILYKKIILANLLPRATDPLAALYNLKYKQYDLLKEQKKAYY